MGLKRPSRRKLRGDHTTFLSRVRHYRLLKLGVLGFRPKDRLGGVSVRGYLSEVTRSIGVALSGAANIATIVRGATKRKDGIKGRF